MPAPRIAQMWALRPSDVSGVCLMIHQKDNVSLDRLEDLLLCKPPLTVSMREDFDPDAHMTLLIKDAHDLVRFAMPDPDGEEEAFLRWAVETYNKTVRKDQDVEP